MESGEEDKKLSDKKMEGDKDLRTLECLRGRLLAERQASRLAKEDSKRMGNKLVELENILKQEIKMRNKAEKKLKFLKKKLESLNISSILVESDQSSTSEKSEVSFTSSTIATSASASEENDSDINVTNSVTSQDSSLNKHNHESPHNSTITFSSSSSNSPEDFSDNPSSRFEEVCSKSVDDDDNNSSTDLRSSVQKNETDHEEYVDNSLALVPVNLPESKAKIQTIELKPVHENVAQVLDSLRYIRERIQSSMEMRHMVRVGPT